MSSGRERAVIVWGARLALATKRLDEIERELEEQRAPDEPVSRKRRDRIADLEGERKQLTLTIARLGPSPQPKMG
jgi:hypothetical protein